MDVIVVFRTVYTEAVYPYPDVAAARAAIERFLGKHFTHAVLYVDAVYVETFHKV